MRITSFAFDLAVARAAADRWAKSAGERDANVSTAENEGIAAAETQPRLARRAMRLVRMVAASPDLVRASANVQKLASQPASVADLSSEQLEAVIGETKDFLSVEFLETGADKCGAVCRTVSKLADGSLKYGSGFLVSPKLMITNHHVIADLTEASTTAAEFGFELRSGVQLPVHSFQLNPTAFFLTDQSLDFTLVAVCPTSRDGKLLTDYGFCPLIGEDGKIMVTEPANIIQHPAGRAKEVVVRQNRLLHLLPNFAQYEADTEPGSSGSPVFNDQWDVVALHHSGIPKRDAQGNLLNQRGAIWHDGDDPQELAWEANEGIRVSALFSFIQNAAIPQSAKPLRDELLLASNRAPTPMPETTTIAMPDVQPVPTSVSTGSVTLTIPLQITVSLGGVAQQIAAAVSAVSTVAPAQAAAQPSVDEEEASIQPDPNYSDRPGYQTNFLGLKIPLPKLRDQTLGAALDTELKYYHYSVLFNKTRKMAYVSAVNYFATAPVHYNRTGPDKWFEDPRAKDFQTDDSLYTDNFFDRGHLTRRADGAWGLTQTESKLGNDDTFHFTNCTPQHEVFNQGQKAAAMGLKLWGNLETYVQQQTTANTGKVSVLNGPVFRASDRPYRGILLPKEFYKVICYIDAHGKLKAAAFILSQESLIQTLPLEEMVWTPYKPFQVKMTMLEQRTHMDFGPVTAADALTGVGHEAFVKGIVPHQAFAIESLDSIVL